MSKRRSSIFSCVTAPAPRYMLRMYELGRLFEEYLQGHGQRFIEVGPGRGDLSDWLMRQDEISGGVAYDFSEKAIDMLRNRMQGQTGFTAVLGDPLKTEPSSDHDFALAFEVLEHVEEDRRFLNMMNKALKPGGLLLLSVPAFADKWEMSDEYAGHVRRYERTQLSDRLEAAGFTVEKMLTYGFPLVSMLRPIRNRYYKGMIKGSLKERTQESGTERPMFEGRRPFLFAALYYPFMLLQRLFVNTDLGDGFIAVARKHD